MSGPARRVGRMIRAGVEAMGMKLLAPGPSQRHGHGGAQPGRHTRGAEESAHHVADRAQPRAGRWSGVVAGKIFRIGHLGFIDDADAYTILALLEAGLIDTGLRTPWRARHCAQRRRRPEERSRRRNPSPVG